jgi:hypothetical protein
MPNQLTVDYIIRSPAGVTEEQDVYVWNGHRYLHEIDQHGNAVVYKVCTDPEVEVQHTHVRTYAKGVWTVIFLDFDEHA